MATLPLCSLASGARRASREGSPQRHKGHKEKNTNRAKGIWTGFMAAFLFFFVFFVSLWRILFSSCVFLPHLIQKPFGVGGHLPSLRPKAEINTPPVGRHARFHNFGNQLVPLQNTLAEGCVRAGLVVVQ